MDDVSNNGAQYDFKVPATKPEPEPDDVTRRMQERGRLIDIANYRGTGQPTVPDSPGEEGR